MVTYSPWNYPERALFPCAQRWRKVGWNHNVAANNGGVGVNVPPGTDWPGMRAALLDDPPKRSYDAPTAPSQPSGIDDIESQRFRLGPNYGGSIYGAIFTASPVLRELALGVGVTRFEQVLTNPTVGPDVIPPGASVEYDGDGVWDGDLYATVDWSFLGTAQVSPSGVIIGRLRAQGISELPTWLPGYQHVKAMPVVDTKSTTIRLGSGWQTTQWTLGRTRTEIQMPASGFNLSATTDMWETAPTLAGYTTSEALAGGAEIYAVAVRRYYTPPRWRFVLPGGGSWRLRQRQSLPGSDSWPLRQRQNGVHSGAWSLRQRQRGV